MKEAKGFTITELLIAVAVLGIAAAVAVPNYNDWAVKSRVNSAARELYTELHLARMKAISENNNYVITFNTSAHSYSIYDDDDSKGHQGSELVKTINIAARHEGVGYGSEGNSPTDDPIENPVTFSPLEDPGDPGVTFRPTGMLNSPPESGGGVYLMATGSNGQVHQRLITVLITGRIRLYKHTGTGWD